MLDKEPRWSTWLSVRATAALGVGLALMVLATNEASFRASEDAVRQRDQAVEARSTVSRAHRIVMQMESAQRGFLLTGRPEYREPYELMRGELDDVLKRLRALAERNTPQRETLLQLIEFIARKASELSEVLRLHDAGRREAAMQLMLTGIGREQAEQINAMVDEIARRESRVYAEAGEQRQRILWWSRAAIGAMVLLALATLFAGLRLQRQREDERERHLGELSAERDKLEREVARRTEELSDLALHLQTVREDERQRLARELHDELGALLTAAKLDVARVRKRIGPERPDVIERVDHLSQSLDAGIALKRRIIEDLHPSSLANLGLAASLEILCSEFGKRSDLEVAAEIDAVELAGERALALYRLAQEALTNVAKYAKARRVQVSLRAEQGRARVEVRDDGVGFDPAQVPVGRHGLAGMRFRLKSCGGSWSLHSAPGQGTRVAGSVPL